MKKARLLVFFILITIELIPQASFRTPHDQMFGLDTPGTDPVPFFPEVFNSAGCPHGQLAFSPDGKTVFWSAIIQDGPGQTIFVSKFDGKNFSRHEIAPFAGSSGFGGPAFSKDGKRLFFNAELPGTRPTARKPVAICYVEKKGTDWGPPIPIDVTIDTLMTKGQVSVARNGNIYFTGRVYTERTPGIYLCRFSHGMYLPPEKLHGPITGLPLTLDPFIDPDEQFLLLSCPPREGPPLLTEIGISFPLKDGGWSLPVRIGGLVNTEAFERFPMLSRDGRHLFFIRSPGQQFVNSQASFYWISSDVLKSMMTENTR